MSERLNWGLIGGGEGSQIGFAHRIGAELDGKFKFAAGALDVDPQRKESSQKDQKKCKSQEFKTNQAPRISSTVGGT